MELAAVKTSYKYWAPVYDYTFGWISRGGRRRTVDYINSRSGRVLEIGVGTGLSLDLYRPHLEVTGIDVSPEMLDKARQKVAEKGLTNVARIGEMDARALAFPDDHFDTVVAMYVISVVPEPEKVMEEMARVCKPDGQILLFEHGRSRWGWLAWIQDRTAQSHYNNAGCRWNQDPLALVRAAGLQLVEAERHLAGVFHTIIIAS